MGGKSQVDSSTTNTITDNSVQANTEGAIAGVVGDGNTTNVNILDAGAVGDAFSLGSDAIDAVNQGTEFALDTVNNTVDSSLDFGSSVVSDSLNTAKAGLSIGADLGRDSLSFSEEALNKTYEFGTGSLDAAYKFSSDVAEQSSIESRAILNAAINAANDAQSGALKFARDVSSPQQSMFKTAIVGIGIITTLMLFAKVKK